MRQRIRLLIGLTLILHCTSQAHAQNLTASSGLPCKPTNLGQFKTELRKYEESGQYERDLGDAVRPAKDWLAQQVRRKGKLAIVLDIDETSLSNWPVINADDFGFIAVGPCDLSSSGVPIGACGWIKWIMQARDKPIIPTLELYRQARRQGVAVFFITGRPESLRAATERNLRAAGYSDWNALVMEPGNLPRLKSAADFKAPARKKIEEQGYTIVLDMGDQQSDLLGGYAERTFKLPDPFYYVP